MFKLQDVSPDIASRVDYMNVVVIVGPEICGRCDQTAKLLDKAGIRWVKVTVEDSEHPLIKALKDHLGVKQTDFVNLPMVFVGGIYRWHDMNGFEIHKLTKSRERELVA